MEKYVLLAEDVLFPLCDTVPRGDLETTVQAEPVFNCKSLTSSSSYKNGTSGFYEDRYSCRF